MPASAFERVAHDRRHKEQGRRSYQIVEGSSAARSRFWQWLSSMYSSWSAYCCRRGAPRVDERIQFHSWALRSAEGLFLLRL